MQGCKAGVWGGKQRGVRKVQKANYHVLARFKDTSWDYKWWCDNCWL